MNTREILLEVLKSTSTSTLNNALAKHLNDDKLSKQEKAYITNVSHQIYRYKLRFEALIYLYSHKGRDITDNAVNILLIAVCEIFKMQSIPLHASINEAVELAKKHASKEVALINAILRRIDKEFPYKEFNKEKFIKEIKFLYPKKTLLEFEACYASLPSFVLDIVRKQKGKEEAEKFLATINEIPYYSYRFNAKKSDWEEKRNELAQTSMLHNFFATYGYASQSNSQKAQELHEAGYVSMHGASSQAAVEKIYNTLGDKLNGLWDACAGVGGKSIALAERGISIALASDTSEKRLEIYEKERVRLGLDEIKISNSPLQEVEIENINCIILDAPCSGTGTLCSNPDLRYKISKKSIKETIEIQKELLKSAYDKLNKDGYICYLTCSINKDENECLIEEFSKENQVKIISEEYILPPAIGADTLYLAIIQKI